MSLQEDGRNPSQRKEYVHHPDLLLVGVDVSKAKHHACMGTQTPMSCRKFECTHTREGFRRFEQPLKAHRDQNRRQRLLIAMEPSGIYWQALDERLNSWGYGVCLVHCQAVRHHRKTMPDGTRKTDEKDAASIFDLLRQGKCFLPVARAPALQAASRLLRRPRALKKRGSHLRHHLRAAIPLTLPALHPLVQALTQPTALRFLQVNPTPTSMLRNGQRHFLETWQPRSRCGPGRPEKFQQLYDLAPHSIGLSDPYGSEEFALTALAHDVADALATHQLWLAQASALLAPRTDCQGLLPLPRIGPPTAAAILPAMGALSPDTNGTQRVTLAGLDIRVFASGSRLRKRPKIAHGGRAYLSYWLSHDALRLVAQEPHCTAY